MTVIKGVQTPRIELLVDYTTNAYKEAVELARAYGNATPDKWQEKVLKALMGEDEYGFWAAPMGLMSAPRQNGKNQVLEARELYGLVILNERIMHTAHEVKTSLDHFRRMQSYFEHPELSPMVRKISNTNGSEAIWLHNGGVVRFVARSKHSGRGFSADLLVCDEAQDLDDDKFSALLPVISASRNGQTILTGTPPGPNVNGEVFTRLRDAGVAGKEENLVYLEWSADKEDDLDSVEAWAKANPALNIRIKQSTIANERVQMDDEAFARERLGMWNGVASTTVVDMEQWAELTTEMGIEKPVAFAIDVNPDRTHATIGMASYVGDKVYVEVVASAKGTGWVVDRIKKLKETWEPVAIVIDQGSPADSLFADLQAARVRVTHTGTADMAQACGFFLDAVNNERLLHFGQPGLDAALASATKRPLRDAFAWNRKNPDADISPLVAVTLAIHGLRSKRKPKAGPTEREPQKQRVILM